MQKNSKAARTSIAPAAATTPMPAFASVDNPLLLIMVGIGDAVVVLLLIGGEPVLDGWAVGEVDRVVEKDVVEKSERSVYWYSTQIGCAHIVSGPITAVVPRLESPTRSSSTVAPDASG